MRKVVETVFLCLWPVLCAAQDPAPNQAEKDKQAEKDAAALIAKVRALREAQRRIDEPECPFVAPRLSARNPDEVAWAAARLTTNDCQKPEVTADLIAALHRFAAGKTEEEKRAVLHLLHAALQNGLTIPIADLRFQPEGRTRIPWIALQTRAATQDGREVFELFHTLDEKTDAGWEMVGGSLALRGHGAFAIELRTQMVPRLRVFVGPRPRDENEPKTGLEPPGRLEGFPAPPIYHWDRGKYNIVTAAFAIDAHWNHSKDCKVDAVRLDRTKLRWLAQLVGEPDAVAWAARFQASFVERDVVPFQAFSDAAEKRATESLQAVDLELRRRFKIPERLVLPGLEVVWEDCRLEATKKAQPLPARR